MPAIILEIPPDRVEELWKEFWGLGHLHWEDWCVEKFGHAIKFDTQRAQPFCYITFLNEEDAIQFKLTHL